MDLGMDVHGPVQEPPTRGLHAGGPPSGNFDAGHGMPGLREHAVHLHGCPGDGMPGLRKHAVYLQGPGMPCLHANAVHLQARGGLPAGSPPSDGLDPGAGMPRLREHAVHLQGFDWLMCCCFAGAGGADIRAVDSRSRALCGRGSPRPAPQPQSERRFFHV